MADHLFKKPGLMSRRVILGTTVGGAIVFFIAGIIFWGGFHTAMEETNTLEFCIGCHEMEENVYQEYTPTIHYSNRTGVRATCPDCHVPRPLGPQGGAQDPGQPGDLSQADGHGGYPGEVRRTPPDHGEAGLDGDEDDRFPGVPQLPQLRIHEPQVSAAPGPQAAPECLRDGQTCIDCHKGIAHKDVRKLLSDEELEALEGPNPAFVREVPEMYLAGLREVEAQEAEAGRRREGEETEGA